MIRRGRGSRSRRSSSTTSTSSRKTTEPARNHVFRCAAAKALGEIGLADFIAANLMFEQHIFVRLHEADLRAAVPARGMACATTRRCASARTTSCSLRPWRRAGAASSSRASAIPIMSGRDRSRACSNCIMSQAMLAADAAFVRDHPLDARAQRRASAANPQPRGGGGVPGAGPAPEGQGAAEGGRRGAARPGRRCAISACRSRRRLRRVARSFNARAFDRSA